MTNHTLHHLIKDGDFDEIDDYFEQRENLTTEEKDLLLSGLTSTNWRIRHRCSKYLRLGILDQEACQLLIKKLNDNEDLVVVSAFITLIHQELMHDFICDFLFKKSQSIVHKRYPNALFLDELYKTVFKLSFVDPRFSDLTDKVLQASLSKNTKILGCNTLEAIRYTSIMGHNRKSTIDLLFKIIEISDARKESRWAECAVNSLCAIQLPTQEYQDQVYELASRYGFWIKETNMLLFARQYAFTDNQKKPFILSILRTYKDITEQDYAALLELRSILEIDSKILMEDPDIQKIKASNSYSKAVFKGLIDGNSPFTYMVLQRTPILNCEVFKVIVDDKTTKQFLLDFKRKSSPQFAALHHVHQKDLKLLEKASDYTITEYHDKKEPVIVVSLKYGWQTDFRYSPNSFDSGFYRGDNRDSLGTSPYDFYLELAQREMHHEAFGNGARNIILQLFDAIYSHDFEDVEKTWLWVEHNLSPHYFNIAMLSSFALTLLDIHFPQETPRSTIKGCLVQFYKNQTTQEILLHKLLADVATHYETCQSLEKDLEVFCRDMLQPQLSDDANRAYSSMLHALKSESNDVYAFWLQWFGHRCQHTQTRHHLAVLLQSVDIQKSVSLFESILEKEQEIDDLFIGNMTLALQQLGDSRKLQTFQETYASKSKATKVFCHDGDPTKIPDNFDIEGATLRMNYLSEKMTLLWKEHGNFSSLEPLLPEALFLQIRVLHYWLPHPLSDQKYPIGKATSSIMVNYLYYVLEKKEFDTAFDFLEKHLQDKSIYSAQLETSFNAQKILGIAIQIACATEEEKHKEFAVALMDWMPEYYIPQDGWSFVHLACGHLLRNDIASAVADLSTAVNKAPEYQADMLQYLQTLSCYEILAKEPNIMDIFDITSTEN